MLKLYLRSMSSHLGLAKMCKDEPFVSIIGTECLKMKTCVKNCVHFAWENLNCVQQVVKLYKYSQSLFAFWTFRITTIKCKMPKISFMLFALTNLIMFDIVRSHKFPQGYSVGRTWSTGRKRFNTKINPKVSNYH